MTDLVLACEIFQIPQDECSKSSVSTWFERGLAAQERSRAYLERVERDRQMQLNVATAIFSAIDDKFHEIFRIPDPGPVTIGPSDFAPLPLHPFLRVSEPRGSEVPIWFWQPVKITNQWTTRPSKNL